MSVKILIADDHEVAREGARTIIKKARPQWGICGEAANGQETIDRANARKPDVIVLDITMPGKLRIQVVGNATGRKANCR